MAATEDGADPAKMWIFVAELVEKPEKLIDGLPASLNKDRPGTSLLQGGPVSPENMLLALTGSPVDQVRNRIVETRVNFVLDASTRAVDGTCMSDQ